MDRGRERCLDEWTGRFEDKMNDGEQIMSRWTVDADIGGGVDGRLIDGC